MTERELKQQVKTLKNMDLCIHMTVDQGGPYDDWLLKDNMTEEELTKLLQEQPELYLKCCEYFAREISALVVEGSWTKEGLSYEFDRYGDLMYGSYKI